MSRLRRHYAICRRLSQSIRPEIQALERRVLLSGASVQLSTPYPVQGAGEFEIDATLIDSSPINTSTISPSNIVVSGPTGALAVLSDEVTSLAGGTTVSVAYIVQPPGGIWDAADNGAYTIAFQPDEIVDASGQSASAASTTFSAASLTPIDSSQAVAFLSTPDSQITVAGTPAPTLEVTYSDPAGINLSTINSGNLESGSTDSDTSLNFTLQSVSPAFDGGNAVDAFYAVAPPDGAFYEPDHGDYNIYNNFTDEVENNDGKSAVGFGVDVSLTVAIQPSDPAFASSPSSFTTTAIGHQSNGDIILAGYKVLPAQASGAPDSQMVVERETPDGILDPTFGTGGIFTGPTGDDQSVNAITIESDDSILLAGQGQAIQNGESVGVGEFLLAHLTAEGQLDQNFGPNGTGIVTTSIQGRLLITEYATAVAVAPNGTIVAGGDSEGTWAIQTYSASGMPLNHFQVFLSQGPFVTTTDAISQLAFASDGSTIIAVGSDNGIVDVAEFDQDGNPVSGFNYSPPSTETDPDQPVLYEQLPALAVRTDGTTVDTSIGMTIDDQGRIIVANRTPGATSDFAIERLEPNGTPDTTFGTSGTGVVTVDFGGDDDADSVTIQPGGEIIVTGTTTDADGNTQTAVAALNEDGTPDDASFPGGNYVFSPGITVPAALSAGVIEPDLGSAGGALAEAFGNASSNSDNVNITSTLESSSGGATLTTSVNNPGIGSTLSAAPLTSAASTYSFDVVYTDHSQLNAISLQLTGAVTVTPIATPGIAGAISPAASTPLQVASAVVNNGLNGSPRTVTYTVDAPSGGWTNSDNGTYEVDLNNKVILDENGNHAPARKMGDFTVDIPPAGLSVSGSVFGDENDNGVQDPGEAGISGVVVYADENGSGNPSGQPQAITDSSGNYTLGGLTGDQSYEIREVLPAGYSQTAPAMDAGRSVSVAGSSVSGEDFGLILGTAPGSLSGEVYNGLTGAPLSGVTVFVDGNRNGILDPGETSTTTDSSGNYRLSNLQAGTFAIAEVVPSGQTTSTASATVTVTSGAATGPSFADVPDAVASGTLAPNLTGTFLTSPSGAVISGSKGKLTLQINNAGTAPATGPITVSLFASSTQMLEGATKIIDVPVNLKLKSGASTKLKLNFTYPTSLVNGSYSILASIDSGNAIAETSKLDNLAVSSPVTIAAAFVKLSGTLGAPASLTPGKSALLSLELANQGNSPASGFSTIEIFASSGQTLDDSDVEIGSFPARLNIKPSRSGVYRFKLRASAGQLPVGRYYLIANVGGTALVPETTVASGSQVLVT